MAGTHITIEVDDKAVLATVGRLVSRAGDLAPAWREISEYGSESTRHRIEAGGPAPDGTPWQPLSATTLARKTRMKDHILIEHGRLLGSIHPQPGADQAAWGTNVVYAAAMQYGMPKGYAGTNKRGMPIPWGNIPARPYLGISSDDRTEILAILERYLMPGQ